MQTRILGVMMIILVALMTSASSHGEEETASNVYAYITGSRHDDFILHLVDSVSLQEVRSFTIATHIQNVMTEVSPNRRWIAMMPIDTAFTGEEILLYDVWLDTLRTIPAPISDQGLYAFLYELDYSRPKSTVIAWSSDSRQLAFVTDDRTTVSLNLYTLETEETRVLTAEPYPYLYFSLNWSEGDALITALTQDCDGTCRIFVETYDVSTLENQSSSEVLSQQNISGPENLCQVSWSPDGRYLSFAHVCDFRIFDGYKEVYLFDRQTQQLTQVTNFTENALPMTDPPDPNLLNRVAAYNTAWINTNNLLIGADYSVERPSNLASATLIYDTSLQLLSSISTLQAGEMTINAHYLAASFQDTDNYLDVRVIALDSLVSLSTDLIYPAGCNLDWHLTGNRLAYTTQENLDAYGCVDYPERLVFVDVDTNTITQFAPPDFEQYLIPVGWVTVGSEEAITTN